jgi:hypothetical protein
VDQELHTGNLVGQKGIFFRKIAYPSYDVASNIFETNIFTKHVTGTYNGEVSYVSQFILILRLRNY